MNNRFLIKGIFIFLFLVVGLFASALISSQFIPENSGLAGPAILISYILIGLLFCLVISVWVAWKLTAHKIHKFNLVLLVITIVCVVWLLIRIQQMPDSDPGQTPAIPAKPKTMASEEPASALSQPHLIQEMGLGIASAYIKDGDIIRFYNLNYKSNQMDPSEIQVVDSVVLGKTQYHIDIIKAPPWLVPHYTKLDYEILQFKVITMSKKWLEIEVNKFSGMTSWVLRGEFDFALWPDFLLNVFSVSLIDPETNELKLKPLEHSSPIINTSYEFLRPVLIKGDWMQVSLLDNNFKPVSLAWVKWKDRDQLLITYDLLS